MKLLKYPAAEPQPNPWSAQSCTPRRQKCRRNLPAKPPAWQVWRPGLWDSRSAGRLAGDGVGGHRTAVMAGGAVERDGLRELAALAALRASLASYIRRSPAASRLSAS